MGEFLVIRTELLAAADMLEVLGDPRLLYWEWEMWVMHSPCRLFPLMNLYTKLMWVLL